MKSTIVLALAAMASAHGVVTKITGANGVEMPGLTIKDGTPRDCPSSQCGAQADTAVYRGNSPLGRTQGGTVDPAVNIQMFMAGAAGAGAAKAGTGAAKAASTKSTKRQLLGGLFGGGNNAAAGQGNNNAAAGGLGGLLGGGGAGGIGGIAGGGGAKTAAGTKETMLASTAGAGSESGLPTAADDGTVTLTLHQINQDGAGPFQAAVDSTSGGKDAAAFKPAEVTQNVGGFAGLSAATTSDFPLKVKVPAGTTCSGQVGGADNVCIVRVMNGAAAGPFGGSAAFTQTNAQRKRAAEYRRIKRSRIARGLLE